MNPYQQGQPGAPPHPPYPQMPYSPPQPYLHNIGFSGAPQSFGMPTPNSAMHYTSPYPGQYPPPPSGHYPQSGYPQGMSYPGYPSSGYPSQGQPPTSGYPSQGQPPTSGYPSQGGYPSAYPATNESPFQSNQSSHSYSAPPSHGAYPGLQQAPIATQPKKPRPTVIPMEPFNPRADAEVLRKAMKGFGTDEKAIIQTLCKRSNTQRLQIAYEFKTLYGKELYDDLKSECTGHFEDVILALMTPLPQYYAKLLHKAISGIGTDEDVLVEVLCTMSNHEIRIIQDAYQTIYGSSLEQDLAGDTSGSFKRLMVALCQGNRDESFAVDPSRAKSDAQALLRAGELRFGTDESTFNAVLCQRNYPQLAATFYEYESVVGHPFENAIENEFSGDIKEGLLAIVKCVKNRAEFFAERLHASMAGLGTTDKQLIRIIVTRCEVDMEDIKDAFQAKFGKSLQSFIEGDCSGHYKKALLALIGCY